MSCYIVQEADGTSRFTLEDGSGSLLLEFCEPGGVEYNPVGGPLRERRRRDEHIIDEEAMLTVLLNEL